MKPVFVAPREMLERKPRHGQPCNDCGLCCVATTCELGRAIFNQSAGPCPALRFDGLKRSACDVVLRPQAYHPRGTMMPDTMSLAAALLVRAGQGCDARFNGEPRDPDFDAKLDARDDPRAIAQARFVWGLSML